MSWVPVRRIWNLSTLSPACSHREDIWAKQTPVSHCLERVWEPVHEIHNCWQFPTVCGMWMCVKEIPTPVHMYFVQLADECQVQNRPCPFLVLSTRINRWSNQQQRFRVLYQISAFVSTISFIEIPFRSFWRPLPIVSGPSSSDDLSAISVDASKPATRYSAQWFGLWLASQFNLSHTKRPKWKRWRSACFRSTLLFCTVWRHRPIVWVWLASHQCSTRSVPKRSSTENVCADTKCAATNVSERESFHGSRFWGNQQLPLLSHEESSAKWHESAALAVATSSTSVSMRKPTCTWQKSSNNEFHILCSFSSDQLEEVETDELVEAEEV